jgi:hypothetical protein
MADELLSSAVIAFVGTPGRLDSQSPEARVVQSIGDDGHDLLPAVKAIVDAVYLANPPLYDFPTVGEMADAVEAFLLQRYPELSPNAVKIVANAFAFDYK